jgi:hypothetical protein
MSGEVAAAPLMGTWRFGADPLVIFRISETTHFLARESRPGAEGFSTAVRRSGRAVTMAGKLSVAS